MIDETKLSSPSVKPLLKLVRNLIDKLETFIIDETKLSSPPIKPLLKVVSNYSQRCFAAIQTPRPNANRNVYVKDGNIYKPMIY